MKKNENILNSFVNILSKRKHCAGEWQSTIRNRAANIFFMYSTTSFGLLCEVCAMDNTDEVNMGTQWLLNKLAPSNTSVLVQKKAEYVYIKISKL